MFHEDDEFIEFLEETMEITIPEEVLKNKKETIKTIEENLNIKIPKKIKKKRKILKYIQEKNEDYKTFINKKKPQKVLRILYYVIIFILPLIYFGIKVSKNTNSFRIKNLSNTLIISKNILLIIFILLSLYYIIGIIKSKKRILSFRRIRKVLIVVTYITIVLIGKMMIYDNDNFKDYLIKQSMSTLKHQYIANIFYNDKIIEKTLSKTNQVEDDLYEFEEIEYKINEYASEYDKEILTKEHEDDIYKIIKVEGTLRDGVNKYSGYMAVVYDPSHVKIATSVGAGTSDNSFGEILSEISRKNNALVAMNAGGFYDPNWDSNGGIPHGVVIKDGKVKSEFRRGLDSGGMVALTKDNKLVLKQMSADEAIKMGVRDAVDWGPFLIVNGKNYYKDDEYYWSCARTVIGQRKDGIILLLVIDGGQPHSKGASYGDLADIMERYGAINAANMDGGTSTAMTENNEYINIPFNGKRRTIRSLPNAWIVTK